MPVIHSIDKTMKQRIDEYYGSASIYRPNKFIVGFYGEYVNQAVAKLISDADTERYPSNRYNGNQKVSLKTKVYRNALEQWKQKHYVQEDSMVELKWACSDVTIPSTQVETETGVLIDSIKSAQFPLVKSYGGIQQVSVTITEDRHMMMYQFFNALLNRFFTPQIQKPRSSLHKLGMYIAVLQEDFVVHNGNGEGSELENGSIRGVYTDNPGGSDLDAAVSQVFEFNSIVLKGIPELRFENNIQDKLSYTLKFDVPNSFQGSFKTSAKGMRDNTSDRMFLANNSLKDDGKEYITENFEVSTSQLLTTTNGVYEKSTEPE